MGHLKALLTAAVFWIGRWCAKNWELFLLRILPLAGVVGASIDIARHQSEKEPSANGEGDGVEGHRWFEIRERHDEVVTLF